MNYLFIRKTIIVTALMGLLTFTAGAQNWLLLGNSGTSSSTNFIGTKDNQALVFRTNNAERMRILTTGNTGIGTNNPLQKLDVNGNINIRSGFGLFMENHRVLKVDSLNGNIFLGNGVGHGNTGLFNTASGYQSLFSNSTGNDNTANGAFALYFNSSGGSNTATGMYALYSNTDGGANTATGFGSLVSNTSGFSNTATGYYSQSFNTIGFGNTSTGWLSLYLNNGGYWNTATGMDAMHKNTEGAYNSAVGNSALYYNNNGSYNTAVGVYALHFNIDAYYNCAVGYDAMPSPTAPGWNNTAVGSFAGPSANAIGEIYNTVSLGEEAVTTASNQARIGNSSTTSIGGYTNWTNISDGRVKKNIKENVPGLTFINKLKPVTYNLDLDAVDQIIQKAERKDKDGSIIKPTSQEINSRSAKQQVVYTGFVAQDVENAAKELNYDFSGVDAPKNDKDLYGLRYSEFVVPLVQSVQELSKISDQKDATIGQLQKQIDDQEKRIEALEAMLDAKTPATDNTQQMTGLSGASLEQNIPNPFANNTTVGYTLPQKYATAQIVITDKNGRTVKQVDISGSGKGMITIDLATLSSGTYQYSLVIDGQNMNTKQMMLAK